MNLWEKEKIVEKLFARFYEQYPDLERFGENGKKRTKEDINYHFQYMETAYSLQNKKVFRDYIIWLSDVLESRGVGRQLLYINLEWIAEELRVLDETEEVRFFLEILTEGMELIKSSKQEE
ncbi:hypothetical protein [Niallia taxi]|uniref:hypothetical protein n=1 Tax=Niallia taxi TaxID=2499688 RepID=UPI0021A8470E|nr:hypothetical protein [Niallia taxi]MCT2344083.1 hypothetical protein [Niallia taxi]MDE5051290.1 hypothetical protein [Niallia taxi]